MRPASPITTARTSKAVRDRSGVQARLLPNSFPPVALQLNTHNKRCPKAQRLCLRSDLSTPHGRFPDKLRQALSKSHCQVSAPLNGRKAIAASGDATEHGVKLLHRAIAPYPDSPGIDLAGQSEQSEKRRLKTNAPFLDSTAAYLGGESEQSEERRLKTNAPFLDSTVVTTGELPTTNAGLGSPLPSLGMVEHFRWTRLPQSESFSLLVHIPSEVWGCRRVVADENRPQGRTPSIGTGVAVIMRKHRPGPSIATLSLCRVIPSPLSVVPAQAGTSTHAHPSNPHHPPSHTQPSPVWGRSC